MNFETIEINALTPVDANMIESSEIEIEGIQVLKHNPFRVGKIIEANWSLQSFHYDLYLWGPIVVAGP